jgi:hypothetical protein
MATVTPNFNWPVPTSTDLVKDGATAIEALGDSIDASLVDLKGGTSGQVLSKNSNTDMDFVWVTSDDANAIQNTIVDAKGDLITATAADTPARLAVGSNGETLVADSSTSTGLRYQGSMASGKNAVINGGMDIWQRGTSLAVTTGGVGQFIADRWQVRSNTTATLTFSRQATGDTTNLPFVQYCLRAARNSGSTATTFTILEQSFETVNSIPYAGKAITFSFYARKGANYSGASDALQVRLFSGTGTDQKVSDPYTGEATVINSSATLTTTWQRFTYTGTVASTATELGIQIFYQAVGTAGAADFFEITGVQIELGSVATAFARNGATIQGELDACQRYYQRISGSSIQVATGMAEAPTDVIFPIRATPQLRVTATSIDFSAPGVYNGVTVYNGGTMTLRYGSPSVLGCRYQHTSGVFTAGTTWILYPDTNGYVGFSAEL